MNVYVKQNTFIAKVAAKVLKEKSMAVTVGNTIYLHNTTCESFLKHKVWVCHEVVHVLQYKKSGMFLFLINYIFQSVINGYQNNKFEIEASEKENNPYLLNDVDFIIK